MRTEPARRLSGGDYPTPRLLPCHNQSYTVVMNNLVSFRVPREQMDRLSELAEEVGVSPTLLCRAWVIERLGGKQHKPHALLHLSRAQDALSALAKDLGT